MSNIIIGNQEKYERKIQLLDPQEIVIVADFDHTITAARGTSSSSFNLFGTIPRLSTGFEVERARLFDKYYPYEVNPNLEKSERDMWMQKWWTEALELHKKYRLHITDLDGIDYDKSVIRDGWREFLGFCGEKNIPVHILSAGVRQVIEDTFRYHGMEYQNMNIIANTLTWDNEGYNTGTDPNPPIYTGNKIDHTVDSTGKQVILFGDSIDDASMAHPKHDETTLRVAIYNTGTNKTIEQYLERFDVVIQCSSPTSDEGFLGSLMNHLS